MTQVLPGVNTSVLLPWNIPGGDDPLEKAAAALHKTQTRALTATGQGSAEDTTTATGYDREPGCMPLCGCTRGKEPGLSSTHRNTGHVGDNE